MTQMALGDTTLLLDSTELPESHADIREGHQDECPGKDGNWIPPLIGVLMWGYGWWVCGRGWRLHYAGQRRAGAALWLCSFFLLVGGEGLMLWGWWL